MIKNKSREKKLKIALVGYTLSSGGLERVISNMSHLFHDMGYDVHLYILRSEIDYSYAGELHQYNIDKYHGFEKLRQYLKIRKSLIDNQFDYIIDHRYRINAFSELVWQRFIYKDQNVINYIHSSFITHYLFPQPLINQLIFNSRPFFCVSKGIEKMVNSQFPKLKTKTVYNPISVELDDTAISENHFILAITRMDKSNVKQVDTLLECYSESNLSTKGYQLVIIGSGERLEEMQRYAVKLQLENDVIFKGFMANPYNYLKNAYFTVLTSKYEGLPTVLAESLLAGTPVISFDCETGPREIITDGENGLLVENQNKKALIVAMDRLANDESLYQKLKGNSLTLVKQFSRSVIEQEWQFFFENRSGD
ncbi:MAG: glycosyltransferase [Weeksellaceae bacterium]|nr:glycosyltransferase [Weeksellaceae bacterium]